MTTSDSIPQRLARIGGSLWSRVRAEESRVDPGASWNQFPRLRVWFFGDAFGDEHVNDAIEIVRCLPDRVSVTISGTRLTAEGEKTLRAGLPGRWLTVTLLPRS